MRLLIAGGGTGGHLFPGVAVAEALRARDPAAPVLFVGTARGIESRVLPGLGWELERIDISGIKTVGLRGAARALLRIPRSLWQSRRIIKRFAPDVVIGVGGYASGPVVLAARLMGLPTAILEQNSVPGVTNKILGRLVRAVFLSFEQSRRFFPAHKVVMSGNPIRRQLLSALQGEPGPNRDSDDTAAADQPGELPRVFVCGGSQGAVAVNELVAGAAAILAGRGVAFSIVHQTGERDLEVTRQRYADAGVAADCRAFIQDMAAEYRAADLIVSRAGATTVAELGVVGRPAILIPYPHAADNHQERNADELVHAGAARVYRQAELTPERLADAMAELLADAETRARMGSAMKALGRPDAASAIVDWCDAQRGGQSSGQDSGQSNGMTRARGQA